VLKKTKFKKADVTLFLKLRYSASDQNENTLVLYTRDDIQKKVL